MAPLPLRVVATGSRTASQSAVTASDGRAFFESGRTRDGSYCFTFTVDGVNLSGATYDAASNVESSDSVGNGCSGRVFTARGDVPAKPSITAIRPNPFNPRTEIFFYLPNTANVKVEVYDLSGRRVATLARGVHGAGENSVTWTGKDDAGRAVSSGVYLAKMVADGQTQMQRMTLLK